MADAKISQLSVATTPLAGTELVPVVQGGVTVQTTVGDVLTGAVPSGTANGVLYLNGSKVVTSGSALTYNGTGFGIGISSAAGNLDVYTATTSIGYVRTANQTLKLTADDASGRVDIANAAGSPVSFTVGVTEQMRLTSTGLGIGTSSPGYKLDVNGTSRFSGVIGVGTTPANYGGQIDIYTNSDSANNGIWVRNDSAGSAAKAGIVLNASGNSWRMSMGSAANNSNALTWEKDISGSPSTLMTLDSSGNLGLGVTPSAWGNAYKALQVSSGASYAGSSNAAFWYCNAYNDNTNWRYVTSTNASGYAQFSGAHAWFAAPSGTAGNPISFTQAMTLDASGRLGIGTTSPSRPLDVNGGMRLSNDSVVEWGGVTTTITGSSATNTLFFTTNSTERARITSGGDFVVGNTSAVGGAKTSVLQTGGALSACYYAWNNATTGDNYFIGFGTEGSVTTRGSIDYDRAGGLVRYNTTSDYRAKDIIGPVRNPGAIIDALKVYEGVMKGATRSRPMLIAHEAQEHAPYAVSGVKDELNEDGTPKFQQMDVSSLVPLLLAEIQSLRARVAALETN